jgi:hypothetical protein
MGRERRSGICGIRLLDILLIDEGVLPMTTKSVLFLSALFAFIFFSVNVQADSIDGRWCNKGRQVTIEGPVIITPRGKKVTGTFDRHSFSYTIPTGDQYAGEKGDFVVQHDDLAHFTRSGSSQFEEWQPCPSPTS